VKVLDFDPLNLDPAQGQGTRGDVDSKNRHCNVDTACSHLACFGLNLQERPEQHTKESSFLTIRMAPTQAEMAFKNASENEQIGIHC
jgi:hypothetical protein